MIPLEIRKELIEKSDETFSISTQCKLLDINRSTLYYTPSTAGARDLDMMKVIDELYMEDPSRGTRRMKASLRKRGFIAGRHKVRSLMRLMRIKTIYCRPRTTVIDPGKYKYPYLLRYLDIEHPNQVWALDISYIPMPKGFMYLVAIMDLYSRYIVGWSLSNTMEAEWVVNTLRTAIGRYGKPGIINSDQGSQFTSDEYIGYVKSLERVKISMDGKGRATDNAFIERFFRTIKYDKLYIEVPRNGLEINRCCEQYISFYNARRDHSELNYDTPGEWYRKAA
jgi:putative transposase